MSAPYGNQQPQGQPGLPLQPVQTYPPPPPPQGHPQSTTVVVGAPTVTVVNALHETPVTVTCPLCHQAIVSRPSYEIGTLAWLICGAIILAGCIVPLCWLGFCFIPFCVKGCKDVRHTCPNCNNTVGVYRRM